MTSKSKSTVTALCVKSAIVNQEITEEAQKLLELYNDPSVAPEQKEITKRELDWAIQKLENKVETTKRIRSEHGPEKG